MPLFRLMTSTKHKTWDMISYWWTKWILGGFSRYYNKQVYFLGVISKALVRGFGRNVFRDLVLLYCKPHYILTSLCKMMLKVVIIYMSLRNASLFLVVYHTFITHQCFTYIYQIRVQTIEFRLFTLKLCWIHAVVAFSDIIKDNTLDTNPQCWASFSLTAF